MQDFIESTIGSIIEPNWAEKLLNEELIKINNKWMNSFLSILNNHTTLRTLNLRWTSQSRRMRTNEIGRLCEGIMRNPMLNTLNFTTSKIGDSEILCLAEGLNGHKSLTSLNFSGNLIEKSGVNTIKNWVKNNYSLTHVTIFDSTKNGNNIKDEEKGEVTFFLERMNDALQKNKNFMQLIEKKNTLLKSNDRSIATYEQICEEIVDFCEDTECQDLLDTCGDLVFDTLQQWHEYIEPKYDLKLDDYERLWIKLVNFSEYNSKKLSQVDCSKWILKHIANRYERILQRPEGNLDNYLVLCHEVQDLSDRYSEYFPKEECQKIVHKILTKRHTLLFQNLTLNNYKQLFDDLQDFSKKFPDLMTSYECGDHLLKFLKKQYQNLQDNKKYKRQRNNDDLTFDQLFEAIQLFFNEYFDFRPQCEKLIFSLLTEKIRRFRNQSNKTNEQFDSLYSAIHFFADFYFDSKLDYKSLIDSLMEILNSVNHYEDTIPMKELNDIITQLKKENSDLKSQNGQLLDLWGSTEKRVFEEKNKEIEKLTEKQTQTLSEINQAMNKKENEIYKLNNTLAEKKHFEEELLSLEKVAPKMLDGFVSEGKIQALKHLLIKPDTYDIKYLCLLHLSHELINLKELQTHGAIVTWKQLSNVLTEVTTIQIDQAELPRHAIKRLQAGLRQLKTAWLQGTLDKELELELDQEVIYLLKKDFSSIEMKDEIQIKLIKLKKDEIQQWFKHKNALNPERLQQCNQLIFDGILKGWLDLKDNCDLHIPLDANCKLFLLKRFKAKQLPEQFSEKLNEEVLNGLIYSNFTKRDCPSSLQKLIISEGKLIKQENNGSNFDKATLDKIAVSRISKKWFNDEPIDQISLEFMDKIGSELLQDVSMSGCEHIDSELKTNAVNLLLDQLESKTLDAGVKRDLKDKISEIITLDAPTIEQVEQVIQCTLQDFKAQKLSDELNNKCLSFINSALEALDKQLKNSYRRSYYLLSSEQSNKPETSNNNMKKIGQTVGNFNC